MVPTGKTGANAIFEALDRCRMVNSKYHAKFVALITQARADGAITPDDASRLTAFANSIQELRDAAKRLADYHSLHSGL